ncbi:phage portal protein [Coralliovum pocilloporae]|uniref:phage portal protein n=1 Tax=Coralliovum pocilloporae TaxID=3066369 RepID=UPI003306E426
MFGWLRREPVRSAVPVEREEKASRTGGLIAFQHQGQPVWTPRDYGALAREGYTKNPIVYRCVRMIAEAAASVPWILYQGRDELDEHPILTLLDGPNERQGGAEFLEELYGHVLVAGNAYAEALAVTDGIGELHVLRPDRMKVVPGRDGWPDAYDYTVSGRTVRFRAEEGGLVRPILHLTLFHPLNDHYGFAPLEAAQTSLDVHNAAGVWNKALLDNSARPSGALVYAAREGGNLTDEQFERLKAELEDGFSGSGNAGRPLLLEGGLDWKAMALSPRDMDFLEAKNGAARDIALAFGVPPMLLGIPGDNTFANYQEANRAFWRQTILPLVGRTAKALTTWLAPAYGGRLRLWYDADQIDALSSEREALWQRVNDASFLSDSEKREAVGYSPERSDDPVSGSGFTPMDSM